MAMATVLLALAGAASANDAPLAVQPEDYVVGSWELYRAKFVTEEGRITDDDNGMISHSEGQGYGLLFAAAAGDRPSFDRIWKWTETELLVRDDALAAWRWDPDASPHVTDRNDATDGDLLIAWALLRASERWNVSALRREARSIVDDVVDLAVIDSRYGKVLLPAAAGFDAAAQPDGPVVNLSYWVFPAIEELSAISPKLSKAKLLDSGLALAKAARFGPAALPSDWIALGGGTAAPAKNFPAEYAYNAVRVPLYLAWTSHADDALLMPFADAWTATGTIAPRVVDVTDGETVNPMAGPGYLAIADLMACSLKRQAHAAAAAAFVPTSYYPSTLHILSLMALSERYPQCL